MDVTAFLARVAVRRASVLLVEAPGAALARYEAERLIAARGWRPAASPADADVLLTCGDPGPRLSAALDLVWAQLPGPRARVSASGPERVGGALDQAAHELLDDGSQRAAAAVRPVEPVPGELPAPPDDDQATQDDDQQDDDQQDDDQQDDDHGEMDHGDMGMAPHGIPLAGGDQDRDGLEMDVLHLPLGPVLPHWPAGLVLHCTLHGDVVMDLRPEVLDPAAPDAARPSPAALALDRAARVLTLARRRSDATTARRLRDDVQHGHDPAGTARALDHLLKRVRAGRVLRWSLGDVGRIDADTCREHGLDERLAGSVHDRLVATLEEARGGLDGATTPAAAVPLDLLPGLLTGAELGAVRLVVAGLELDLGAREPREVAA